MARVAVVTGGTRGIGRAISVALKDAGYNVAANYGGNDKAAQEFHNETGIPVFKFDVADFNACAEGVKKIEAELGPIEVLVNNAGITRDSTMHRMSWEQWNAVIQTNLSSCFNMSRAVIEGMLERGFGRIVNIGSINGQAGQYGQEDYAAAQSGIPSFAKALAQEGRPKGHHGERDRAGLYRYRYGGGRAAGRVRQDHRAHPGRPPRQSRGDRPG